LGFFVISPGMAESSHNTPQPTGLEHIMLESTTTRDDFRQDRQRKTLADVLNNWKHPFDALQDFFLSGVRPIPIQDSATHHEQIPLVGVVPEIEAQPPINFSSKHPHSTKRSRQAVDGSARVSMEHHGWKQTGTKSPLWAFEHRWAHRRDHAEGRNHRLPSN
jgi:hypothetical protein